MLCQRCRLAEALQPSMCVYGSTGAFCARCFGAIAREFLAEHPEVVESLPPGLTIDQFVEGQLRGLQTMLSTANPADPEQVRRKFEERG